MTTPTRPGIEEGDHMTPDGSDPTMTTTVPGPPSPPAARLRLSPTLSRRGALDGSWWPRSRDAGAELPALVAGLDPRFGVIIRAMLDMDVWDDHPRRVATGPKRVHMGWYHTMTADRIYLVNTDGERFALLVVPPEATAESARAAMAAAAEVDGLAARGNAA